MKVLELFSGSRTFSKVAERDFDAKTLTIDKYIESDFKIGVEDVTHDLIRSYLGQPDIIWASPVCSAWSKTGWFHYWDTDHYRKTKHFKPKKDFASDSHLD